MAGREGDVFVVNIDAEDSLQISEEYENKVVNISGYVSTIELLFINAEGKRSM